MYYRVVLLVQEMDHLPVEVDSALVDIPMDRFEESIARITRRADSQFGQDGEQVELEVQVIH